MSYGKVYLVGAGPGDSELLTLKGARVMASADVVVYDALISESLLTHAPETARFVYVGKRAGNHAVAQEDTIRLMIDEAKAGKSVVRLKGGDPFLFGRGGEELEALLIEGITTEVIPGVTSPIAASAYAGIPLTHRDYSSSLHIYTAHAKEGSELNLDYASMSRTGGTLVFLMGVSSLNALCDGLLGAGMDASTPAAVIERGTTARERLTLGTLGGLPALAKERGVSAPALIVVGKVAALADKLNWRARLPLCGLSVAVTRPKSGGRLASMLREQGADVIELPSIRTRAVEADIPPLGGFDCLAFSSPAGVEYFFLRLSELNRDIREFSGKLAAVGPATARELRSRGLCVDIVPEKYDGASLSALLSGRVLHIRPKADSGSIDAEPLILYETLPIERDIPDVDVFAFASASAVRALGKAGGAAALCIGESTAKAARNAGYGRVIVAKEATLDAMVEALVEYAGERPWV